MGPPDPPGRGVQGSYARMGRGAGKTSGEFPFCSIMKGKGVTIKPKERVYEKEQVG